MEFSFLLFFFVGERYGQTYPFYLRSSPRPDSVCLKITGIELVRNVHIRQLLMNGTIMQNSNSEIEICQPKQKCISNQVSLGRYFSIQNVRQHYRTA